MHGFSFTCGADAQLAQLLGAVLASNSAVALAKDSSGNYTLQQLLNRTVVPTTPYSV